MPAGVPSLATDAAPAPERAFDRLSAALHGKTPESWTAVPVPKWVPASTAAVAVGLFFAVALQRHLLTHPGLGTVLAALACAPWLIAVRWPIPILVWAAVTIGSVTALIYHPEQNDFAPFVLTYLAGTAATAATPALAAVVVLACAAPVIALQAAGVWSGAAAIWTFACIFAAFFGASFRWQLSLLDQLQRAQASLGEAAAAGERQRLAREIHDLIAHSLSVTMLQITGARLALTKGDAGEALAGLAQAERTGREAMTEIRRTVGLLGGSQGPTASAAPTAADIRDLVTGYQAAGLRVEADIDLGVDTMSPGPGLAAYRVVQESLTNAAKHAPGAPVVLSVAVTGDRVAVTVSNPLVASTEPDGDGHGLIGMRQRVDLLGGRLEVGRDGDCWRVEATLPLRS